MNVPEIIQIKTLDYLQLLEKIQKNINDLQYNNEILRSDCERYKKILSYILDLDALIINGKSYISLDDIVKICEAGMQKREM